MAGAAAFDVHFRLRPVLTELATDLLSTRRGIDLERSPSGRTPCSVTTSGRSSGPIGPEPAQRHAPGIDEAELDRIVTALERV